MARKVYPEYNGMIGAVVRKHRERLGLSTKELAAHLGHYSQGKPNSSSIWGLETGEHTVSWPMTFKLCEVLGQGFADELTDLMYEAIRKGKRQGRDELLAQANELVKEAQVLAKESKELQPKKRPRV